MAVGILIHLTVAENLHKHVLIGTQDFFLIQYRMHFYICDVNGRISLIKESGLSTGVGQTAKMGLSEKCYY